LKCRICGRTAGKTGYCEFHSRAYENIIKKFDRWRIAVGVSWKEYLSEIAENQFTGEWAREVAEHLAKMENE
jgi:hypothetical protein